jgi:hypothetical protein
MPSRNEILGAYLGQIGQGIAQWSEASAQAKAAQLEARRRSELLDLERRRVQIAENEAKRKYEEAEEERQAREDFAKQFDKQYGGEAREGVAQMAQTQARSMGPTREAADLMNQGVPQYQAMGGAAPQAPAPQGPPIAQQPTGEPNYSKLMALAIRSNNPALASQIAPRLFGPTEVEKSEMAKRYMDIELGQLEVSKRKEAIETKKQEDRGKKILGQYFVEQATEAKNPAVARRYAEANAFLMAGDFDTARKLALPGLAPNLEQAILIQNNGDRAETARQLRRYAEKPSEETLASVMNDTSQPKSARTLAAQTLKTLAEHTLATKGKHATVIVGPDGSLIYQGDPTDSGKIVGQINQQQFNKELIVPSTQKVIAAQEAVSQLDSALQSVMQNPSGYTASGGFLAMSQGLVDQMKALSAEGAESLRSEIKNLETGIIEQRIDANFYRTMAAFAFAVNAQEGGKRISDADLKFAKDAVGSSDIYGPVGFAQGLMRAREQAVKKHALALQTLKAFQGSPGLSIPPNLDVLSLPPAPNVNLEPLRQQERPSTTGQTPVPTETLQGIGRIKEMSTEDLMRLLK